MAGLDRRNTAPRATRLAAITPDQIEQRPFAIEEGGYDRTEVRKFLAEVAATLRLAQRSTVPPLLVPVPPTAGADPSVTLDRVPAEVTRILRAAELSAQARRDEAEAYAAAVVERAEHDAEHALEEAADAAAAETDRARRVLFVAQEQAMAVLADAEQRATAMLDAAREHARQHARRIAGEAQRRADEVSDAEAAALLRLNEARVDLVNVIDTLAGSQLRTILDLTGPEAELHITRRDADDRSPVLDLAEPTGDDAPAAAVSPHRGREQAERVAGVDGVHGVDGPTAGVDDGADDLPVLQLVADDDTAPTRALIRRAVERATTAATGDRAVDLDVEGASQLRVSPVRPSVKRRKANRADARPSPGAAAPTRPSGRPTPVRRTET